MLETNVLEALVLDTLDDAKATDICALDVRKLTDITSVMVICTGNSARHIKAISSRLIDKVKEHNHRPLGSEGELEGEWILVDLDDVVVHIMQPKAREFYSLEKLWSNPAGKVEEE